MTARLHDSPLKAFDVKVITEVANFKEKGLVNKGKENFFLNTNLFMQGIELWSPVQKAKELTTTLTVHWYKIE